MGSGDVEDLLMGHAMGTKVSKWMGIGVADGRVTKVDWSDEGLCDSIPSALWKLSGEEHRSFNAASSLLLLVALLLLTPRSLLQALRRCTCAATRSGEPLTVRSRC